MASCGSLVWQTESAFARGARCCWRGGGKVCELRVASLRWTWWRAACTARDGAGVRARSCDPHPCAGWAAGARGARPTTCVRARALLAGPSVPSWSTGLATVCAANRVLEVALYAARGGALVVGIQCRAQTSKTWKTRDEGVASTSGQWRHRAKYVLLQVAMLLFAEVCVRSILDASTALLVDRTSVLILSLGLTPHWICQMLRALVGENGMNIAAHVNQPSDGDPGRPRASERRLIRAAAKGSHWPRERSRGCHQQHHGPTTLHAPLLATPRQDCLDRQRKL
jgi:hypothetical protein